MAQPSRSLSDFTGTAQPPGETHVLLLDNFDSFSWNLAHQLSRAGATVTVMRNDATLESCLAVQPTHVVVSPGPGAPAQAGVSPALIRAALGRWPLLGVCLGHQALAWVLGGTVGPAIQVVHGRATPVRHAGRDLFEGLPDPLWAGRYHSLAVTEVPDQLEVLARAEDGEVMAVRHRELPAWGVQFHPESVLTPQGNLLVERFLRA